MAMKSLSKAVALAAIAVSGVAVADTPTLKEVLGVSDITVSGYIDAAYGKYNLDPDEQTAKLNYFEDNENSFYLKQAAVTIASQPKEGFGGLVNLTLGNDAKSIHSTGAGSSDSDFDVTQAWLQYATGPLTVYAGKFNTLAGAEVIAPTGNTNISRSIAFLWALPFTHTGLRVSYAPLDTLTLYAGINNGWDQQKDNNSAKTGELGFVWNPTSYLSWAVSAYSGKEVLNIDTPEETDENRTLIDTVVTVKPVDGLSLVLNYDYGKQDDSAFDSDGNVDDAEWEAIAGYINYQFNELWRVSVRAEQFNDKDGFRIGLVDQSGELDENGLPKPSKKTRSYTLTVGYAPTASFELRGEVRQDHTDEDALIDGDSTKDKQTFVALEGIYKF